MNNYVIYFIESSISLLILFLIFKTVLNKSASFGFNRIFLLSAVAGSFIIPLIEFPIENSAQLFYIHLDPINIQSNSTTEILNSDFNMLYIFMGAYLVISSILIIHFIIKIQKIRVLKNQSKQLISPLDQQIIYTGDFNNFSFFKWIFINENDVDNTAIYIHEKQHVKNWHSLDIIILKLLEAIFWMNPILYLIEKELRLQHEYMADSKVLEVIPQKNNYRQLLLNQLFNTEFDLITNSFNQKYLKNRFIMMTKGKSKKVGKILRYTLIFMVFTSPFIISCSMDTEKESSETITVKSNPEAITIIVPDNTKDQEVTNEVKTEVAIEKPTEIVPQVFLVVQEMPKFPGGEKAMYSFIAKNIKYPEAAKKAGISGRVFLSFIVEKDGSTSDVSLLRGIGYGCDEAAIEVVKAFPKWKAGKQHGQNVRVQYRMPIKFELN